MEDIFKDFDVKTLDVKDIPAEITAANKKGGRPSKKPDDSVLLNEYRVLTAAQIAERYSVPVATARSWIAKAQKKLKEMEV